MYITTTVPDGVAVSAWVPTSNIQSADRDRLAIVGVYAPVGLTQPTCSIQGSWSGGNDATGFDVLDQYGNAKSIPLTAGKLTDVIPAQNPMALPPYIRVKLSGNATADRIFQIGLRPV